MRHCVGIIAVISNRRFYRQMSHYHFSFTVIISGRHLQKYDNQKIYSRFLWP